MVRKGIEAWNRHDFELGAHLLADDLEWVPASPAAVEQPVYHGKAAVARGLQRALGHLGHVGVRGARDPRPRRHGALAWRVHMRGGASQVELVQEAADLLDFVGEQVVRVRGFRSWQEAIEAAGA